MSFIAKDFGFIHLPRTGGTFLESFLAKHINQIDIYGKHIPAKIVRLEYPEKILFGFVRHPVEWYRSVMPDITTITDLCHFAESCVTGVMESQFKYYFCDNEVQIVDYIFRFEDGFINCLNNFVDLNDRQIDEIENSRPVMARKSKMSESKELVNFILDKEQFIINRFYKT